MDLFYLWARMGGCLDASYDMAGISWAYSVPGATWGKESLIEKVGKVIDWMD